jgi:pyrroloquinoline-quinone synthase
MHNLEQRIDLEIERRSLLKHKFYQLWLEGKLNLYHLQGYSKEYFQLVKAVPGLVQNIYSYSDEEARSLKSAMKENLKEESEHVQLWVKFAASLGVSSDDLVKHISSDGTNNAVSSLVQLTKLSFEQGAAAMYAYEKQLPDISRSKIEGLKKFYGLNKNNHDDDDDAAEYFEVHEQVDVRHAALWRNILQRVSREDFDYVFNAAAESLDAQNRLLDSVYERYIGPIAC